MEPVSEYKEDRDSEDPSEYESEQKSLGYSQQKLQPMPREIEEESEEEYDPRLESKINKIKRDL